MGNKKIKKHERRKRWALRAFISIILTVAVLFAYYYPELCHENVIGAVYYVSKEHFKIDKLKTFIFKMQEKLND